MSSQTSLPQREELTESAEWREEVVDRLKAHRARRRNVTATPMSLNFDSEGGADAEFPREELKRVRAERRDAARAQITLPPPTDFRPSSTLHEPANAAEIRELAEAVLMAIVEPAPVPAEATNVIEFPRQLVTDWTPQPLSEIAIADEPETEMQLRIFEADIPDSPIGTTRWAGLRLDDDRHEELHVSILHDFELPLQVAPLARRAMCHATDALLLMGACAVFAVGAAFTVDGAPDGRTLLALLVAVPVLLWAMYQCVFLFLGRSTPGMNYARLGICNFEDAYASRSQRIGRAFAGILSLVSLGMGYLWVFADEDGLGWHDRMTRTYLREMGGSHDDPA